jgi:3-methyladenine DNA glycosylase AlkD
VPKRRITPDYIAADIRRVLKDGGSAAEGMQRFFPDKIQARGWRSGELRKVAVRFRRAIQEKLGSEFLLQVADKLFAGRILEEKIFAVLMLEKVVDEFGNAEFRRFESWLPRIHTWSDHDALVHYLIAPMIAAKPARIRSVFRWARSPYRWHRRAACVGLIQGTRRKMFFPKIVRLSGMLLSDEDDMVQKGLGWLLRETAKADAKRTVPYLMKIRGRAPRLVLRTACETLPKQTRAMILMATA